MGMSFWNVPTQKLSNAILGVRSSQLCCSHVPSVKGRRWWHILCGIRPQLKTQRQTGLSMRPFISPWIISGSEIAKFFVLLRWWTVVEMAAGKQKPRVAPCWVVGEK